MPSKKCGANKTDGTGTCGQAAGWGTDHPGYGRDLTENTDGR